jgi:hypothetical protein
VGATGTLKSLPRRVVDSVRQEGGVRFAWRALMSPVYRAEVLRVRPLRLGVEPPSPSAEVRLASKEDLPALVVLNPRRSVGEFEKRLAAGDDCLIMLDAGAPRGYMWASTRQAYLNGALVLPLRADEVFSYDMYIHPLYRRRRLRLVAWAAYEERYWPAGVRSALHTAYASRVRYRLLPGVW